MNANDWWCVSCREVVWGCKAVCRKCGSQRPAGVGVSVGTGAAVKTGDWPCGGCGLNNFASRRVCFKCKRPKAGAPGVQPSPSAGAVVTDASGGCCCVCMTGRATVAIVPCGHLCLCQACGPFAQCPICRGRVERTQTIFA